MKAKANDISTRQRVLLNPLDNIANKAELSDGVTKHEMRTVSPQPNLSRYEDKREKLNEEY